MKNRQICLILGLTTQRESLAIFIGQPPPRIQTVELKGFVYSGNRLVETLTASSANYSSNFDADGLGSFGWSYTNTTGAALQNLRFVVFLDADIDRKTILSSMNMAV
jgi:hypothetical protein